MTKINRRTALGLGAAFVGGGLALANGKKAKAASPSEWSAAASAVLFWNEVALKMNVLDHSFTGADAAETLPRAPGPVASARALGVVHAVIADALFTVDPSQFKPHFLKGIAPGDVDKELFVGGAAAAIMFYIYDTGSHLGVIKDAENEFVRRFKGPNGKNKRSWEAGRFFGNAAEFQRLWSGDKIRDAIHPTRVTEYQPRPGDHQPDPFHCGQGYYGQIYAREIDPIIISRDDVETNFLPLKPPNMVDEPQRWQASLDRVRDLGQLYLKPNSGTDQPDYKPGQLDVGYFWAYDGARFLGTPPRLYNQIIREIAVLDGMSEAEIARLLALCNLAMSDAGNVAWHAKYHWRFPRPVIGIREANVDPHWRPLGSPKTNVRLPRAGATILDPRADVTVQDLWLGAGIAAATSGAGSGAKIFSTGGVRCESNPDLNYVLGAFTPNFPAYPSGHATFGAAAFDMLRRVRGERTADANSLPMMEHVSDELNGASIDSLSSSARDFMPQPFETIDKLIEKNNESRELIGVHWDFDSTAGAMAGIKVAEAVHENAYQP